MTFIQWCTALSPTDERICQAQKIESEQLHTEILTLKQTLIYKYVIPNKSIDWLRHLKKASIITAIINIINHPLMVVLTSKDFSFYKTRGNLFKFHCYFLFCVFNVLWKLKFCWTKKPQFKTSVWDPLEGTRAYTFEEMKADKEGFE